MGNAKVEPALLFENIKDYKDTRSTKLLAHGIGSPSRVALAIGLPRLWLGLYGFRQLAMKERRKAWDGVR